MDTLQELNKIIKSPNETKKLSPLYLAAQMSREVEGIFTALNDLYWDFKLRHFFGPINYIPTPSDQYWRIRTYSHLYDPVPIPQKRSAASQHLARRKIIKQRGNACERCSYPGYVELHHIIEFRNGGTFDNNNLLLLCELCHAEAHGKTKRKYLDKAREHWQGQV